MERIGEFLKISVYWEVMYVKWLIENITQFAEFAGNSVKHIISLFPPNDEALKEAYHI